MVRDVKANPTASLRFQAHLALLTNYLISMEFVNTLYFPQCLPLILKCQKSLQARPTRTHGQKDNAAKMKDRLRNDKNGQLVTCGIFYCRDSAGFSVSASNKLLCNLTVKCFEIGNKNIPLSGSLHSSIKE